jgi:hypothetical protein
MVWGKFMGVAAAAVGAVALRARAACFSEEELPLMVHVSDTHIQSAEWIKRGDYNGKLTRELFKDIAATCARVRDGRKVAVVITGDVTDSGDKDAMKIAHKVFADAERENSWLHVLPVIGNHDTGTLGLAHYKGRMLKFMRRIGVHPTNPKLRTEISLARNSSTYGIYKVGALRVIAINSMRAESPWRTFDACGAIGSKQRKWIRGAIGKALDRDAFPVLALHHHPWMESNIMELRDAASFAKHAGAGFEKACGSGLRGMLLFGHKHSEKTYGAEDAGFRVLGGGAAGNMPSKYPLRGGHVLAHQAHSPPNSRQYQVIDLKARTVTTRRF